MWVAPSAGMCCTLACKTILTCVVRVTTTRHSQSVTAEMTVMYRNLLPLNTTVLVDAHIESSSGRKHVISSSLSQFPPDDEPGGDPAASSSSSSSSSSSPAGDVAAGRVAAGKAYSSASGLFIQLRQHPSDTASRL